jgi:aminopeptidase
MKDEFLRKFAQFILKSGVNIQKGQNISVTADPYHWNFLSIFAEEAYKLGARFVDVNAMSERLAKARIDNSKEDYLDYVSAGKKAMFDAQVDEKWCRVFFDGKSEPGTLANVDKKRFSKVSKGLSKAADKLRKASMSNQISWCVAALPTPKWAANVLNCEATKEAEEKLWELLAPIYRLDQPNPAKAWGEHSDSLAKRASWLNDKKFKTIKLKSEEGTDLEVGLIPVSTWQGGSSYTPEKVRFSPNIPTEEIFTTPDFRQVNGTARCTRPVLVLGSQVEGAWFKFKDGKVIEYGADKGRDAIKSYLDIDEGASFLGELALVGCDSPIFKSGKVFESILFDENASCHIALGSGYEDAVENATGKTDEELKELGCNKSLVHTDFMIGSESTEVIGVTNDGTEVTIMKDGLFVI